MSWIMTICEYCNKKRSCQEFSYRVDDDDVEYIAICFLCQKEDDARRELKRHELDAEDIPF